MAQRIKPFSNGTEAMWWMENNCDRCIRADCYAKRCINYSFKTGEIPVRQANWIGYENNRLKQYCNNLNKPNTKVKNTQYLQDKFQYNIF